MVHEMEGNFQQSLSKGYGLVLQLYFDSEGPRKVVCVYSTTTIKN